MSSLSSRLAELGLELPALPKMGGAYAARVRSGDLVFITGQVSYDATGGVRGTVGTSLSQEDGWRAARISGLNIIAQIDRACKGDLARLKRIIKLGAFLQSSSDFKIADVINGASDLIHAVFGERGIHARSSVGQVRIPMDFTTEIDAIIEVAA
jgi:enamine deaminase RidA (YjgF/YER057c/UK114 family)